MWYDPGRLVHHYYKGWPVIPWARILEERRYDLSALKDTILKILKVVSYVATAIASFIAGLNF